MDIHEYQAKEILRANGIPVPPGEVATTPDEAVAIAERYGGTVVVKAQVHSGGRGKAGGVKLAASTSEVREHAENILGMKISGLTVEKVLITPAEDIDTEAYVGVLIDRKAQAATFIVSAEGGIDIEEVAHSDPDAIRKLTIDPRYGLMRHQAYGLANSLYQDPALVKQATKVIHQLYAAFASSGASMIEINPLISTDAGEVKAIDAKMSLDDSELFRHPELVEYRDLSAEPTAETRAREADLSYVKLDGNVGCCVNGAGLAMATMDVIQQVGSAPANFLDVGGGGSEEQVAEAFKLIVSDPDVKKVLINVFGGILRCDVVAGGVVSAYKEIDVKVPIVVRMTGTNAEEGGQILRESGIPVTVAADLNEAAAKIAAA